MWTLSKPQVGKRNRHRTNTPLRHTLGNAQVAPDKGRVRSPSAHVTSESGSGRRGYIHFDIRSEEVGGASTGGTLKEQTGGTLTQERGAEENTSRRSLHGKVAAACVRPEENSFT